MKESELREQMYRRAEELARTGKYDGWLMIEHALKSEGYRKARAWLDNRQIRSELDELCGQHHPECPGR